MTVPAYDEGSFRDPEGHVFVYDGQIYRTLSPSAAERMKAFLSLPFVCEEMGKGRLIPTKLLLASETFPKGFSATENVLWHEKVANMTYPFEWTFSMLKDAALLTLELMEGLLENNYILKDGTAWNVCFVNGKPCFYDILSIDTYQDGQPWEGLTQFLQEFLYPLMIQAYHGLDFQPLWRATQQGIPVSLLYKTLPKTALLKKGVFKYVFLQEKFSANKAISEANLKQEFSSNAFPKQALLNMLKDLRKCITSLQVTKDQSVWKEYDSQNSYEDADTKVKEEFIEGAMKVLKPSCTIDLGCNTGHYSFIAAKYARVISCDLDPTCVDYIYMKKNPQVLPVVQNLMTPSPSMGWKLSERKDVFSRLQADTFLALALMHHLCIAQNVPLESFVKFLKTVAPKGVLEWVDKTDPMVQFLLRNRKDIFPDYTWENFEKIVKESFKIEKCITLNKGARKLLLLMAK